MMLIKENVVPYSKLVSRRRAYHVVQQGNQWQVVEKGTKRVLSSWRDKEEAYQQCRALLRTHQLS